MNADGYVSTGQGLNSFNMFVYCANNPIMYVDINGNSFTLATVGTIILNLGSGFLSVYLADIISNTIAGEKGLAVLSFRSSLGDYLGSMAMSLIPGNSLKNVVSRLLCGLGITWSIDYGICKEDIDVFKIFTNIFGGVVGEGLSGIFDDYLHSFLPDNYSQFKHDLSQFFPNINRQETYTAMKVFNQVIDKTSSIVNFFLDFF